MSYTIGELVQAAESRRLAYERAISDSKRNMSELKDLKATDETRAAFQRAQTSQREAIDGLKVVEAQLEKLRVIAAEDAEIEAENERAAQAERKFTAAPRANFECREYSLADGTWENMQSKSRPVSGGTDRASQPSQFRRISDGKDAVLSRDTSFRDHEIVQREMERTAERDKHIVGMHGDFGQLVRSISTTSGAAAMVPTMWSADIIDKARNAAVVMQAGASLVPMDGKLVQIARLTQDPAPVFRTEGNTIPATDPNMDYITLTATSLGTIVVASVELLQDAPNASEVVQNALVQAMALEIDKAALFGQLGATGSNDEGAAYGLASPYPKGLLKNLVDYNGGSQIVGAFPTNGTAQTAATPWNELLAVVYKVLRSNEQAGALVSNTALVQQYDGMYDTLYNPIRKPDVIASRPWLQTNAISSFTRGTMTSRATDVFCGNWPMLLVGQRLDLQIRVLTERYAELGQVGLLAFWRGDVQLARPTAFAAYRGLQGAV